MADRNLCFTHNVTGTYNSVQTKNKHSIPKIVQSRPPLKYIFLNISASNGQNSFIFCRELEDIWGYLSTDFGVD